MGDLDRKKLPPDFDIKKQSPEAVEEVSTVSEGLSMHATLRDRAVEPLLQENTLMIERLNTDTRAAMQFQQKRALEKAYELGLKDGFVQGVQAEANRSNSDTGRA